MQRYHVSHLQRRSCFGLILSALCVAGVASPLAAESVVTRHMIPMRDGVHLATDVYLPSKDAKNLPCILMRTPYGRTKYNHETGSMAEWGYAVAIQDTRGRFDSEGKAMAFLTDGWGKLQDGYDTVEWLAAQDFCNGRVGTVGASAMGITQQMLAPAAPPHLQCQYILVAPACHYDEACYPGGVFRKKQVEDWLRGHAHPDALTQVLEHPRCDEYWNQFDCTQVAGRVRVPGLHYGGWYDTFCQGTIHGFLARQNEGGQGARGRQKLVMGPWTHGGPGKGDFGDFKLPKAARKVPNDISARRWFDHYLKDNKNQADAIPTVIYYVMGPLDGSDSSGNVWRTADAWPIPAEKTAFYLGESGSLSRKAEKAATKVQFTSNPANPVPTLGGRNLFLKAGPVDQRKLEIRDDVVTFTTEPLEADTEVTGRLTARLFVSIDQRDADVAVRLCDVYPDGRSILIAEGIRRLSSLNDLRGKAKELDRSEVDSPPLDFTRPTEVPVDLWSTSLVFAKGHRIRVSVSGSNYPRWDANHHGTLAGDATAPPTSARITLHLGGKQASYLELPIVPPAK